MPRLPAFYGHRITGRFLEVADPYRAVLEYAHRRNVRATLLFVGPSCTGFSGGAPCKPHARILQKRVDSFHLVSRTFHTRGTPLQSTSRFARYPIFVTLWLVAWAPNADTLRLCLQKQPETESPMLRRRETTASSDMLGSSRTRRQSAPGAVARKRGGGGPIRDVEEVAGATQTRLDAFRCVLFYQWATTGQKTDCYRIKVEVRGRL